MWAQFIILSCCASGKLTKCGPTAIALVARQALGVSLYRCVHQRERIMLSWSPSNLSPSTICPSTAAVHLAAEQTEVALPSLPPSCPSSVTCEPSASATRRRTWRPGWREAAGHPGGGPAPQSIPTAALSAATSSLSAPPQARPSCKRVREIPPPSTEEQDIESLKA